MRASAARAVQVTVAGVTVAGVVMCAGLGPAAASSPIRARSNPTDAQIRTAIKHAESSKTLWATVNICNSKRYPNTLGVRAEMPALGFPSWMSFFIQVNYYSQAKRRFEPSPSPRAKQLVRLGRTARGLEQGGATFSFPPDSGPFNATIDFRWRRSGHRLGHTLRRTTAGHRDADFGSPPHYSAKQCLIR